MTLRISLRDAEPVIVNGAVLRARGRTELQLENDATILRGRDVMKPDEAVTPAKRLYFACMMAYIDPRNLEIHRADVLSGLETLLGALEVREAKAACVSFAQKVAVGNFYAGLADCRWLIAYEADAMARVEDLAVAAGASLAEDGIVPGAATSAAPLA
ncbi:flagellar biosynthesis repressor FlbT [Novosphingobium profundi]|uniref:flagellar biosynthesis repressor FlbT n=1 Tax=Novosphingobium profundi TaxID=1774954 RepID=UPI001BD9C22B|nr:flagellar biosynthesis repressor FlbT [Novosphingobium profundi]MBT0670566.1 flagellar biosynthesis repressor FlbT [Novosphingobium profundi]